MLQLLTAADDLPLSGLGQLGAVGAVLAITFWFFWQVYKRESDRADKNEAEIARINQSIIDKHADALVLTLKVVNEVRDLLILYRDAPPPRRRP